MRSIIACSLLLLFKTAGAQWFNSITAFTTQNGLSNNFITCFQKDSKGFVWIGTHEGLNRYDGTAFINVLSNARTNIPTNNITRISFISDTLLAVATNSGLCFLNTTTFTGRKIELPFIPKYAASAHAVSDLLYLREKNELWVATWHGIFVLDKQGNVIKQLLYGRDTIPLSAPFAESLMRDNGMNVYFFSKQENTFYYPDFTNKKFIPVASRLKNFKIDSLLRHGYNLMTANTTASDYVCTLSQKTGNTGTDYICYYNFITGRNFITRPEFAFPSAEKRLSDAWMLDDTTMLVNSYFGAPMLLNTRTNKLTATADHPLWFASWPDGLKATIFKDDNNIWIGTSQGLLQSSLKNILFKTDNRITTFIGSNNALVGYSCGIYHDKKLWLSCMGAGLFSCDTADGHIQTILSAEKYPQFRPQLISTDIVPVGTNLWLFSLYGPAFVNTATGIISHINAPGKDVSFDGSAAYPLTDHVGNIWVTLPGGVSMYDTKKQAFINHRSAYNGGDFPILRAGAKTEDAQGNIWMARQDTIVKYEVSSQRFISLVARRNNNSLRPIANLCSDGGDVIYMNVAGYFGVYHTSSGKIDLYSRQTGIVSTFINDMVCDKHGNAWLGTEGGLVVYDKQMKKFTSYTRADGLPDDAIRNLNFTDDSRNSLFIGFAKTYAIVNPDALTSTRSVPQNRIIGVELNGQLYDPYTQHNFSYDQNSISFTYTGINFNQGVLNNYACMLEGFDKEWKYTGTERKVNYINLPPGPYTFKVKSTNHQGEWNEAAATFTFNIAPPYWQQWWFRGMVICAVIFSIYYFIKKREAALQKENAVQLQMSELRMQALRAQMNPHFIFNSLNSIQNYILSNNTIDAAAYLSKFAKLMRRILDQSKHNFLPLEEVMETLRMYVEIEAFRFSNEFTYVFDVEENDELQDARIPPMLLQPFVENAILHGLMPKQGLKKLTIACRTVSNYIEIVIDDNGIGRRLNTKKDGHESQGEKLTAGMLESLEQMRNIKASIQITDKTEDGAPAGTTVTLTLPLN